MVILKKSIPRRTFLRGAGAAIALPMLGAMTPAFAVETKRPIRMAFMQTPNGIFNLNHEFTPKTEGADWEMTPTLKPLEAFRDRIVIPSGLDQQMAAGRDGEVGGDHPRACTAWLTGTHAKMTSGADIRGGVSVDQIAAREFGKSTQLASLEVSLECDPSSLDEDTARALVVAGTKIWLHGDANANFARIDREIDGLPGDELAIKRTLTIEDGEAKVLEICADARRLREIEEALQDDGGWVQQALDRLQREGIVLALDDRYLTLALPENPYW